MGKSALVLVLFFSLALMVCGDSEDDMYKPKRMPKRPDDGTWRTKDVRDYNDGDLEKLYDQWEVRIGKYHVLKSDWPAVKNLGDLASGR